MGILKTSYHNSYYQGNGIIKLLWYFICIRCWRFRSWLQQHDSWILWGNFIPDFNNFHSSNSKEKRNCRILLLSFFNGIIVLISFRKIESNCGNYVYGSIKNFFNHFIHFNSISSNLIFQGLNSIDCCWYYRSIWIVWINVWAINRWFGWQNWHWSCCTYRSIGKFCCLANLLLEINIKALKR